MNSGIIVVSDRPNQPLCNNGNISEAISCNTEVRLLPSWVRARLGQMVEDRTGLWLTLMAAIPSTPPWTPGTPLPPKHVPYPKKYNASEIRYVVVNNLISEYNINIIIIIIIIFIVTRLHYNWKNNKTHMAWLKVG